LQPVPSAGPAGAHVVVVGASVAGYSTAAALRRGGHRGTITLLGAEPHPPYDRPPLSKQVLAGEWDAGRVALSPGPALADLDLDLRLGTAATGLDLAAREVRLEGGGAEPYDALVIATGVRPRALPGEGAHLLRTLDDALRLRERIGPGSRLVVVGAGFLGTEAAAVARGRGAHVAMVEPAPEPLAAAVGEPVGAAIARAHREHGVELRTGVGVASVAKDGVLLADGTVLEADAVLVAVGTQPNTEWLEGSGLTLGDGVRCDSRGMAAPGVYAAGDVARWHNPRYGVDMRVEHRTNAAEMGMAVAANLLQPEAPVDFDPVLYFWSDQYDLRIQAVGYLRGHEETDVVYGDLDEPAFVVAYRRGDRLAGVLAVRVPPRVLRPWRQAVTAGIPWDGRIAVRDAASRPGA
jgi:NADPH-dependent 2,4-dienoyl-CoA reductase/sulfur reductase-like enzyme